MPGARLNSFCDDLPNNGVLLLVVTPVGRRSPTQTRPMRLLGKPGWAGISIMSTIGRLIV